MAAEVDNRQLLDRILALPPWRPESEDVVERRRLAGDLHEELARSRSLEAQKNQLSLELENAKAEQVRGARLVWRLARRCRDVICTRPTRDVKFAAFHCWLRRVHSAARIAAALSMDPLDLKECADLNIAVGIIARSPACTAMRKESPPIPEPNYAAPPKPLSPRTTTRSEDSPRRSCDMELPGMRVVSQPTTSGAPTPLPSRSAPQNTLAILREMCRAPGPTWLGAGDSQAAARQGLYRHSPGQAQVSKPGATEQRVGRSASTEAGDSGWEREISWSRDSPGRGESPTSVAAAGRPPRSPATPLSGGSPRRVSGIPRVSPPASAGLHAVGDVSGVPTVMLPGGQARRGAGAAAHPVSSPMQASSPAAGRSPSQSPARSGRSYGDRSPTGGRRAAADGALNWTDGDRTTQSSGALTTSALRSTEPQLCATSSIAPSIPAHLDGWSVAANACGQDQDVKLSRARAERMEERRRKQELLQREIVEIERITAASHQRRLEVQSSPKPAQDHTVSPVHFLQHFPLPKQDVTTSEEVPPSRPSPPWTPPVLESKRAAVFTGPEPPPRRTKYEVPDIVDEASRGHGIASKDSMIADANIDGAGSGDLGYLHGSKASIPPAGNMAVTDDPKTVSKPGGSGWGSGWRVFTGRDTAASAFDSSFGTFGKGLQGVLGKRRSKRSKFRKLNYLERPASEVIKASHAGGSEVTIEAELGVRLVSPVHTSLHRFVAASTDQPPILPLPAVEPSKGAQAPTSSVIPYRPPESSSPGLLQPHPPSSSAELGTLDAVAAQIRPAEPREAHDPSQAAPQEMFLSSSMPQTSTSSNDAQTCQAQPALDSPSNTFARPKTTSSPQSHREWNLSATSSSLGVQTAARTESTSQTKHQDEASMQSLHQENSAQTMRRVELQESSAQTVHQQDFSVQTEPERDERQQHQRHCDRERTSLGSRRADESEGSAFEGGFGERAREQVDKSAAHPPSGPPRDDNRRGNREVYDDQESAEIHLGEESSVQGRAADKDWRRPSSGERSDQGRVAHSTSTALPPREQTGVLSELLADLDRRNGISLANDRSSHRQERLWPRAATSPPGPVWDMVRNMSRNAHQESGAGSRNSDVAGDAWWLGFRSGVERAGSVSTSNPLNVAIRSSAMEPPLPRDRAASASLARYYGSPSTRLRTSELLQARISSSLALGNYRSGTALDTPAASGFQASGVVWEGLHREIASGDNHKSPLSDFWAQVYSPSPVQRATQPYPQLLSAMQGKRLLQQGNIHPEGRGPHGPGNAEPSSRKDGPRTMATTTPRKVAAEIAQRQVRQLVREEQVAETVQRQVRQIREERGMEVRDEPRRGQGATSHETPLSTQEARPQNGSRGNQATSPVKHFRVLPTAAADSHIISYMDDSRYSPPKLSGPHSSLGRHIERPSANVPVASALTPRARAANARMEGIDFRARVNPEKRSAAGVPESPESQAAVERGAGLKKRSPIRELPAKELPAKGLSVTDPRRSVRDRSLPAFLLGADAEAGPEAGPPSGRVRGATTDGTFPQPDTGGGMGWFVQHRKEEGEAKGDEEGGETRAMSQAQWARQKLGLEHPATSV